MLLLLLKMCCLTVQLDESMHFYENYCHTRGHPKSTRNLAGAEIHPRVCRGWVSPNPAGLPEDGFWPYPHLRVPSRQCCTYIFLMLQIFYFDVATECPIYIYRKLTIRCPDASKPVIPKNLYRKNILTIRVPQNPYVSFSL